MNTAGRVKSCTACRQVKLACDSRKTAPEPCSRCTRRNLECRFDTSFKRVSTRRITQEITNGLHHLHPARDHDVAKLPTTLWSSSDTLRPDHLSPSAAHYPKSPEAPYSRATGQEITSWLRLQENQECTIHCLEGVSLPVETAVDLFKHFEQYYFPHIPVLKPVYSLASLEGESPLLFWTILLVASQRREESENLYLQICGPLENLLSRIFLTSVQSVETVQTLLLLCLWPISKDKEQNDPSWNYLGLVNNAAMQINLHSPTSEIDITRGWKGWGEVAKKSYTSEYLSLNWLSCFDIGIQLSTHLGMPPPVSSPYLLSTVEKACLRVSDLLPPTFRALLSIRQSQASSTSHLLEMSGSASLTAHFGLTRQFVGQLDNIKAVYRTCWTPDLEVELQGAKLYLYAMTLALPAADDLNHGTLQSLHRETAYQKGLMAAMMLIVNTKTLSLIPSDPNRYLVGALTFYPKQHFTTLFFATAYLFRFIMSSQTATQQDRELAITGLMDSHKIFQAFHKDRDHVRAAVHIETFVEILRVEFAADRRSSSTDLVTTSRLGASVMWDAVFCAARYRNRQSANGETGAPRTWRTINDDAASRLPLAAREKAATVSPHFGGQTTSHLEDTSWLEPWNAYITDFAVNVEQLDTLEMPMIPWTETSWDPDAMQFPVTQ